MGDIRRTLVLREITREAYEKMRERWGLKNNPHFKEPEGEGHAQIVTPLRYLTFKDAIDAFAENEQLTSMLIGWGDHPLAFGCDVLKSDEGRADYLRYVAVANFVHLRFSKQKPWHLICFDAYRGAVVSKSVAFPGSERCSYGGEVFSQDYHYIRALWVPDSAVQTVF